MSRCRATCSVPTGRSMGIGCWWRRPMGTNWLPSSAPWTARSDAPSCATRYSPVGNQPDERCVVPIVETSPPLELVRRVSRDLSDRHVRSPAKEPLAPSSSCPGSATLRTPQPRGTSHPRRRRLEESRRPNRLCGRDRENTDERTPSEGDRAAQLGAPAVATSRTTMR